MFIIIFFFVKYFRQKSMHDQNSNELGDILNQENLVHEQVSSILRVAKKQEAINVLIT